MYTKKKKKKKENVRSKQHHMQRSPSKAMPFDSQILKQKELGESQTFILFIFWQLCYRIQIINLVYVGSSSIVRGLIELISS